MLRRYISVSPAAFHGEVRFGSFRQLPVNSASFGPQQVQPSFCCARASARPLSSAHGEQSDQSQLRDVSRFLVPPIGSDGEATSAGHVLLTANGAAGVKTTDEGGA